jgi:hypothetical protein
MQHLDGLSPRSASDKFANEILPLAAVNRSTLKLGLSKNAAFGWNKNPQT